MEAIWVSDQKPDVMYADIGGMDIQKQEVREAVELPLTHFELYKQVRGRANICSHSAKQETSSECVVPLFPSDRHRPPQRRPHVRTSWLWKNYAGQSRGPPHYRCLFATSAAFS